MEGPPAASGLSQRRKLQLTALQHRLRPDLKHVQNLVGAYDFDQGLLRLAKLWRAVARRKWASLEVTRANPSRSRLTACLRTWGTKPPVLLMPLSWLRQPSSTRRCSHAQSYTYGKAGALKYLNRSNQL